MNSKEERIQKREQKEQEKLEKRQAKMQDAGRLKRWRNRRPFWGATLTLLAGIMILYIPLHLYAIAFAPGSWAFIGFLFGGLVVIIGSLAYIYPQFSTVFGVVTIFLSILSIMGALGGFIIGTVTGIIGGALCVGWHMEEVSADKDHGGEKKMKRAKKDEGTVTASP
ncbi:DUF6114 domain-containing protein [Salicibibacter halophilus]|uniref:DUF6114 domain-containing protein n=1 Tax=Salicibibacter halophilus TaxID=2502791 RepID=UPI001D05B6DB|nr:DUF6114 domain-containing protein [Salicibibacter halophilus]